MYQKVFAKSTPSLPADLISAAGQLAPATVFHPPSTVAGVFFLIYLDFWLEGGKTAGEAIAMETVPGDPGWWFPCTHWMPLPKPPGTPE